MKKITAALAALFLLCGCRTPKTEGGTGDTLNTMFFDVTLKSAYKADTLNDMAPLEEGYNFTVASVAVKNTTDESIPMGDVDFLIRWSTGEEDWDYPASVYTDETLTDDAFPKEYTLASGETKEGTLIFIVPKESKSFVLETQDVYTSSETGDPVEGQVYSFSFNIADAE